ncbi:MAG: O-antigen ligase family protein, partial [Coriobacteriia bacterium]|nr:O-antigen ligase family protein [Coriobacteriia bacterium]
LLVAVILAAMVMPQVFGRVTSVLDAGTGTAYWRLSTWRSSADMMLDRPVLGFGVNGFRYAYPAYQEAGQNDGRHGYVPIEAAHNLEADTVVSLGLLGLVALLVIAVECGLALWRRAVGTDAGRMQAVAVAASLVGAVVALQFHYVTLDTGPLLIALLAVTATREVAEDTRRLSQRDSVSPAVRWIAGALALAFVAVTVCAAGLVIADRESARAVALSRAGAPWPEVRDVAETAAQLAPWEASVARTGGRAGTVRLTQAYDSDAARDGLAAYDRAIALSPSDPVLVYERANLLAVSAMGSRDPATLESALDGFEHAGAMDPNSGMALVGQARVALVFGDTEAGIALLEEAVELSPLYVPAWDDLAKAYRLLGMKEEADEAQRKAEEIGR